MPTTTEYGEGMMDDLDSPKIVVLGSINMDLVARCDALPLRGQTLTAKSFTEIPGGKGANQAVAASRAGARVSMIGRIGSDAFADRLLTDLKDDRVDVKAVQTAEGPSGVAMITVADDGENQIVVVPGANGCVTPKDVDRYADLITDADVLLLQLEVPMECVVRAIEVARGGDTRVILDPAPAPDNFPSKLLEVDLICPNETEAASLTGAPVETPDQIETAARRLYERGAKAVAITCGAHGTLLFDEKTVTHIEAFPTNAIDTTAAGDAFTGAVAVHWAETDLLVDAIRFGNAAGSIAASRAGAKPSLPTKSEITARLSRS